MKKRNNTAFTVKEQFIIMLVFLILCIMIVSILYSLAYQKPHNNILSATENETSLESRIDERILESNGAEYFLGQADEVNETPEITTVSHYIESFPSLCQWPELPTGCESASLTSVLNYLGFDISMTDLVDNYLPINNDLTEQLGDFRYEFVGNPYSYSGLGCFPPCIETTACNYFSANNIMDYTAKDITGAEPQELYNLISQDIPVIVWVTIDWTEPSVNWSWEGQNGEIIEWLSPEHCLVLIGFDKSAGTVTVSDVNCGYEYTEDMSVFESIYADMGSNAVIVVKSE